MRQNNKPKPKTWKVIFIASLCIFVAGLVLVVFLLINTYFNKPDYSDFTSTSTQAELKDNPIDFNSLQAENSDIYAWIRIPNTNIDYPVVQSMEDDSYYLNHDATKKYTIAGAIYSEMKNNKDFSDPNTILYGHNMLNGSMFQNLHKFRKADFFEQNKYIYIYVPNHILTYEICAAYRYDNRHILNSFNFSDNDIFAEYLEFVKNPKSMIVQKRNVDLNINSKLLTLSTCIGNHDYRYIVQGVLINDEQTK